jgi:uncharacterized protein
MKQTRPAARRRRLLAWLAGFWTLVVAAPALAAPALWVVEGPHAKLYLFGTVHILRPDQRWRSPVVDRALAQSRTLWMEIADSDDPAGFGPYERSLGLDPDHPLSTRLSAADVARIDALARRLGAPKGEASLEPLRPWLASMVLSYGPMVRSGYRFRSGVEAVLRRAALAQGKEINGLETNEDHIHVLADLPRDEEVALLRSTLDEIGKGDDTDNVVGLWAAGDVERLGQIADVKLKTEAPGLYYVLLTQRNLNWAAVLDRELQGDGVGFVAVGAAHLAGPDSLQNDLEARGYRVRRVQ